MNKPEHTLFWLNKKKLLSVFCCFSQSFVEKHANVKALPDQGKTLSDSSLFPPRLAKSTSHAFVERFVFLEKNAAEIRIADFFI